MTATLRRIVSLCVTTIAVVVVTAAHAAAAQITVAWDANTEPDIAGYVVEWGPSSALYAYTQDVGKAVQWTLTSAAAGTTYSFRVVAYNAAGERSEPSVGVTATAADSGSGPTTPPTFSLVRTSLNFGVVRSGATVTQKTPGQTMVVTQQSGGTMTWTVSASQPWVQLSTASGTGSGAFVVSINTAALPTSGNVTGTLTVSSPEATTAPQNVTVRVRQMPLGTTAGPTGVFDTPAHGSSGVIGAVPVTGWAIDDVVVDRVEIWRDPVNGEPVAANGKVFIGNSVFVAGARPDLEALAPDTPLNYRAGWGYLLLTNVLPDIAAGTTSGGNGTFTLYAYAVDSEGFQAFLGSKRITLANGTATKPFGTIDTPGQGETIGGNYMSFGWALSPKSTIPVNGSTINVYIDGVNMGHPTYNNRREDIAGAFPGYANSEGAIGFLAFDTTTLTNGVHTIGWLVSDAAGNAEGLGSRFFTVFNGAASNLAAVQASTVGMSGAAGSQIGQTTQELAEVPVANEAVEVRRAFTPDSAVTIAMPEYTGAVAVKALEMEQVELRLSNEFAAAGSYEGYMLVGEELRPLPSGSALDTAQGIFTWQPGPGFVGGYDFLFVRTDAAGAKTKVPVKVDISPKFGQGKPVREKAPHIK